jgi:hypothetical protein
VAQDIETLYGCGNMATMRKSMAYLAYVAAVLLAFAVTLRLVGHSLSLNTRVPLFILAFLGIGALLALPLIFPKAGLYRSESLKEVDEAMAREESESGNRPGT